MQFIRETHQIQSNKPVELIEITDAFRAFCQKLAGKNGIAVISSAHTTAAIRINEQCAKLEKDVEHFFKDLAPPNAPYAHNQNPVDGRLNTHSHLLGYLMASSETVVIEKGAPLLGQWQSVFFVELDGPRPKREVSFTFMGE